MCDLAKLYFKKFLGQSLLCSVVFIKYRRDQVQIYIYERFIFLFSEFILTIYKYNIGIYLHFTRSFKEKNKYTLTLRKK